MGEGPHLRCRRNPRVLAFVAAHRVRKRAVLSAVLREARRALRRAGFVGSPPPYDPVAIAAACGVTAVREVPHLPLDAALVKRPDGHFEILIRPGRSPGRRHFAILHEVAHTFFARASRDLAALTADSVIQTADEEERLCDAAAAEMLLPATALRRRLRTMELTWTAIEDLAHAFRASISATTLRVAQLTTGPILIQRWWREADGTFACSTVAAKGVLSPLASRRSRTIMPPEYVAWALAQRRPVRDHLTSTGQYVAGKWTRLWVFLRTTKNSRSGAELWTLIRPKDDSSPS